MGLKGKFDGGDPKGGFSTKLKSVAKGTVPKNSIEGYDDDDEHDEHDHGEVDEDEKDEEREGYYE